jgi:lipoprotein NlpI
MKWVLVVLMACAGRAGASDESVRLSRDALLRLEAGDYEKALATAEKAVAADSKDAGAHVVLGQVYAKLRQHYQAVKAFTASLALDPKRVRANDSRGDSYLKLGKFKEAIADFDVFLDANPKFAPEHWRRGIALYYAGRFADGVKQFDIHRTVNPEDVENSAWHYLCNARANTPKKAREDLIPVTKDTRVPMSQVLQLFGGKLKPQDVIDAAEKSGKKGDDLTSAQFYAHLYVALYYDAEGDAKKVLEHLTEAVEKHKIGDYMWDVGAAHLGTMKAKK